MLFNSFEYLIFLPVVFLLYWFAFRSKNGRNLLIILASYVFYAWWDVRFLALIIAVTLVSYIGAVYIDRAAGGRWRRFVFIVVLVLNAGVLVAFKYFDFFSATFARVLAVFGMTADSVTLGLILPVGLSFYVFQAIGYVADVYLRRIRAVTRPLPYFAFISFFPQLVAGPIERASNILPQFERSRRPFTYRRGVSGMKLILWGLFKKMVVADNAAVTVNAIFSHYDIVGSADLWLGAVLFAIQIYGDFSGYSDIAVGTARLFGIDLMQNFRYPYFSRNLGEFWQRWHISLTGWFRDYIYIPLGGSKGGVARTLRNTSVVFLVSGLWHGASLTYVIWGAYHAVIYVPHTLLRRHRRQPVSTQPSGWAGRALRDHPAMCVTFLLVAIGLVIFRSVSVMDAVAYIRLMFSFTAGIDCNISYTGAFWAVAFMIVEWFSQHKECPLQFSGRGVWRHAFVRWTVCVLLFMTVLVFSGDPRQFIYFNF